MNHHYSFLLHVLLLNNIFIFTFEFASYKVKSNKNNSEPLAINFIQSQYLRIKLCTLWKLLFDQNH